MPTSTTASRPATFSTAAFALLALAALAVGPLAPAAGAQRAVAADRWVGADKLKHFLASFFVQSVAYAGLRAADASHGASLAGASAATAAVGLWKERVDRHRTGLFSTRDLVWDAAGAAAASVVLGHSRR
jgi:uncharacterized protein YfiM (DUF2279 family)